MVDQWEAQVLTRVLTRCDVVYVTSGVEASTERGMRIDVVKTVEEALSLAVEAFVRNLEFTVVPGGPSTMPVVTNSG